MSGDEWLIAAIERAYPGFNGASLLERYWENGTREEQIKMMRLFWDYRN